jgi:GTP-binding protein YchF
VPDDRVDRLARVFHPEKTTYVSVAFHDIDAGEPDPLSTHAATAIRDMEVIIMVLRGFSDDYHPVPPGGLDPISEFRSMASALVLSDYLIAQKRIERLAKESKRDAEWVVLNKVVSMFEKGVPMRDIGLSAEEERSVSGFRFLSRLPVLLVLNVNEADLGKEVFPELSQAALEAKVSLLRLCAVVEEEISRISPEEQAEFIKEIGTGRSAKDRLVRASFDAMRYISFMTVGEDEVRAWNVREGTTALGAAGRVHSDLEKGFIRAEVISSEDFIKCGSMAKARTDGKLRLEGKEYIVKDGDIVHIRFNL